MKRHAQPKHLLAALAVLLAACVLAACGSDDDGGGDGGGDSPAEESGGTLGLLIDEPRNDKSFGQATFAGAERAAEELGLELSVVDDLSGKAQQSQTALENLARDADYIIDGAAATNAILPRIAERYPDKQFRVYAVPIEGPDNLHYALQDWYPLGYLAGVVAAMTTEEKVVGFVGGAEIPPTQRGRDGYIAAIEDIDPSIRVLDTITGDFSDPVEGRSATQAQIASGADVVYSFLDAAHEGAVQAAAAADREVRLMSVILPKCEFSEGLEIGDTVASQDQLVFELAQQMVDGVSEDTVFGIQDPEVASFQFCPGEEDPEVQAELEATIDAFESGELESPPL